MVEADAGAWQVHAQPGQLNKRRAYLKIKYIKRLKVQLGVCWVAQSPGPPEQNKLKKTFSVADFLLALGLDTELHTQFHLFVGLF